ncbi:MAG: hypothetical protein ABI635_02985 [Actinomycetota bacterium]
MAKKGIRCLLSVVATSLVLGVQLFATRTPAAFANCFSGEQTIFVGNYAITTAYGTTNWIKIRDRQLDAGCSDPSAWSTAQLGDATALNQVEMGWQERPSGSSHIFNWFWEAQHGSIAYGGCCQTGSNLTPRVGDSFGWRVAYHRDGNFHWYLNDGSGLTEVGSSTGIAWQVVDFRQGWPKGETGRRGGTDTSAFDNQYNLNYKYQASGASWTNWTNNSLPEGQDSIPYWDHVKVSDTEFNIRQCTGTYPDGKAC